MYQALLKAWVKSKFVMIPGAGHGFFGKADDKAMPETVCWFEEHLKARSIFRYHPKELGLLCKSAWQSLKEMFQEVAADPAALPGVVISIQSYGDNLNLHPHIHAIASRGVWSANGSFEAIPALDTQQLMLLFRHHVMNNLLAAGRISQTTVDIIDRFHHPGFSAYPGEGVSAPDSAARERLASYLVHAPFSLARLH
jgi:hypothetical protein